MEAFGLIGFVLGSSGMTFAIIAWGQIAALRKDVDDLKQRLAEGGILEEPPEPKS